MMLKTIWQKLKFFLITRSKLSKFLIISLAVLAIIIPTQAWALDLFGWDISSFWDILSHFFLAIASLLGQLLVVIIDLLLGVVQYNDFIDSAAVQTGWSVVRDICNMFFVLILLVIAFGTILRLQNYRMNRLLGKLIIMIVLVNFSKMIAGFFIDISQVVSMTFVNAFADTAAANFVQALHLREMLALGLSETEGIFSLSATDFEVFGVTFFASILLVIALMTMLSILVVFVVRIVMLWVLVVLSPLAYMLSVIPLGAKYSSQWWSNFGKWVTMGPVLVFFIWLSLTILGSGAQGQGIMGGTSGSITNAGGITGGVAAGISEISTSENLLSFILAVAMLMIALSMAGSLGGVAGGFAGKISGKIQAAGAGTLRAAGAPVKGAYGLAKFGAKAVGGSIQRTLAKGKYTRWVVPKVIKEGIEQKRTRLERAVYPKAAGGVADVLNRARIFNWGRKGYETREESIAIGSQINERMSKQKQANRMSTEELLEDLKKAMASKDVGEREIEIESLLSLLETGNRDLNEIYKDPELAEKLGSNRWEGAKSLTNFLHHTFPKNPQVAMKIANRIGYDAFAGGDFNAFDATVQNHKTGKWQELGLENQAAIAALYMNKLEVRQAARVLRWQTFFPEELREDEEGRFEGTDRSTGGQIRYDKRRKRWEGYNEETGQLTGEEIEPQFVSPTTGRVNELSLTAQNFLAKYLTPAFRDRVREMRPETIMEMARKVDGVRGTVLISRHADTIREEDPVRAKIIVDFAKEIDRMAGIRTEDIVPIVISDDVDRRRRQIDAEVTTAGRNFQTLGDSPEEFGESLDALIDGLKLFRDEIVSTLSGDDLKRAKPEIDEIIGELEKMQKLGRDGEIIPESDRVDMSERKIGEFIMSFMTQGAADKQIASQKKAGETTAEPDTGKSKPEPEPKKPEPDETKGGERKIPDTEGELNKYGRDNFDKFSKGKYADLTGFKQNFSQEDFEHFKEYMVQRAAVMKKGHKGVGTYVGTIASIAAQRGSADSGLLDRIMATMQGGANDYDKMLAGDFDEMMKKYFDVDIQSRVPGYDQVFSKRHNPVPDPTRKADEVFKPGRKETKPEPPPDETKKPESGPSKVVDHPEVKKVYAGMDKTEKEVNELSKKPLDEFKLNDFKKAMGLIEADLNSFSEALGTAAKDLGKKNITETEEFKKKMGEITNKIGQRASWGEVPEAHQQNLLYSLTEMTKVFRQFVNKESSIK